MQELLDKIEQDSGLPIYLVQRHDNAMNCCVLNFNQSQVIGDGVEIEHKLYDFYFVLILSEKLISTIDNFQEVLKRYIFHDVRVNAIAPLESDHKGAYQVSITATKML